MSYVEPQIYLRHYQILCPIGGDPDALVTALNALPTSQQQYTLGERVGPEAWPGAELANGVTHRLDAPSTDDATYQACVAVVAAHGQGALIQDTHWLVWDHGELRTLWLDGKPDLRLDNALHFYDETLPLEAP